MKRTRWDQFFAILTNCNGHSTSMATQTLSGMTNADAEALVMQTVPGGGHCVSTVGQVVAALGQLVALGGQRVIAAGHCV